MTMGVDWECPAMGIGDDGRYRGTLFIDAPTPLAAWDAAAKILPHVAGCVLIRAYSCAKPASAGLMRHG